MKKETKILLEKSLDSLILSVEHFNRPWDVGRVDAVLILLDHSFEMLLKASITHKGGRIRKYKEEHTIGFEECIRKSVSDGSIKFLNKNQALLLQTINSLRDAAQHYIIDISEDMLYVHAQAGITLYADILSDVYNIKLNDELPDRVLPLSTIPPKELTTVFKNEVNAIRDLLRPGKRMRTEAYARLRSISIVDGSLQGKKHQPSNSELNKASEKVSSGIPWDKIFPGLALIQISTSGYGPSFNLKITKKSGTPVHLVPEGTPGAAVVAVKRVDEISFYSINCKKLANHLGLTTPKTLSLIWFLDIQSDPECFKEIVIGRTRHKQYSKKAIERIKNALPKLSIDEVWKRYYKSIHNK